MFKTDLGGYEYIENYGEMYDRLKKDGVKIPFTFVNKEKVEEEFRYITSKEIPDIEDENRYMGSNYGDVIETQKYRSLT